MKNDNHIGVVLDMEQGNNLSLRGKDKYYNSLKPPEVPVEWFAGDLMHYLFAEKFASGKTVLDAGCGLGYGSYHLALNGAAKVTGIDILPERLSVSKNLFSHPNLDFCTADITATQFSSKMFDLVVNFEVLEHLPDTATHQFMKEVVRLLKVNGKFIISTPNIDVYSLGDKISTTAGHINELSAPDFTLLMEKYFRKINYYYQVKYTIQQLSSLKAKAIDAQYKKKNILLRSMLPIPIKIFLKNTFKKPKKLSLIDHMQIWEVKPVTEPDDLDLSIIQIAVCEEPIVE